MVVAVWPFLYVRLAVLDIHCFVLWSFWTRSISANLVEIYPSADFVTCAMKIKPEVKLYYVLQTFVLEK